MTPIFAFWSFQPFTWLERLCVTSWVAAGHPVYLYSYEDIPDLPSGVALSDASELVPQAMKERFVEAGRFALFSDIFRYHGLTQERGIWCDTDILLLRNLEGLGDYIIGCENPKLIGTAVLRMPPDEPFLRQLIDIAVARVPIVPQWTIGRKIKQYLKGLVGKHRTLETIRDTTIIGPQALTWYVQNKKLPTFDRIVFYPLKPYHGEAFLPFMPGLSLEAAFGPNTRAVHLWHNIIHPLKNAPPPPGSFLARMCEKYGICTSTQMRDAA